MTAAALVGLNWGMIGSNVSLAGADVSDPKHCGCIDGSDPEGPSGPEEPTCTNWPWGTDCESVDDCTCPL